MFDSVEIYLENPNDCYDIFKFNSNENYAEVGEEITTPCFHPKLCHDQR